MSTVIVMPQLGESVAEGIIGKWLKQEGDRIEKDEPIVEEITDKVNAEIPSPVAGVLEKITQPEGATVAVGQEIAVVGDSASGNGASGNGASSVEAPQPVSATPAADMAPTMPPDAQQVSAGPATQTVVVDRPRSERVRTSPLVKRLAEEHGINLAEVPGTGIGGRVSKQDILAFIEQRPQPAPHLAPTGVFEAPARPEPAVQAPPAAPPRAPQPAQPAGARALGPGEELVPVSPLRKMIAERMVQSVYTIPHAVTMAEVDMTPVVRYRDAHKRAYQEREGAPLSLVAFVIKATVDALKEFPLVNAEWAGDNIILKHEININVAVDAPEGLTIPVIHQADHLSLAGISAAVVDLARRARERKLKIEDMQGGTFTVNNTGALGSVAGVSIINYPQAGILSSGAIVKRPVVLETGAGDTIAIRSMMTLSFSFDHRVLDGGTSAAFVNAVKNRLEGWSPDYPLY